MDKAVFKVADPVYLTKDEITENIINPRISELSKKVMRAAKDELGNKLDKVILYGSYARGDYDNESDIDFFILADISQKEAAIQRGNIRKRLSGIDLDFDITVSLHVTGSEIFNKYTDTLPFYMNIIKEGVVLFD